MKNNRLIYAVLGTLTMLFSGLIYSWSVLSRPISITFPDWDSATLSFTFTLCMSFFCLGGFLGGILSRKKGIKLNLILASILFLSGFYIASIANSPNTLYLGYGIMAGLASGLVYNTIMSTVTGYFPDKLGLISGTLLMGFGLGSFIIGKVYQWIISLGYEWRDIFFVFGIILFVMLILSSFIIKSPILKKDDNINYDEDTQISPNAMIKKKSFWLFFIWAILLSACGLAIISQASGIILEVAPDTKEMSISTIAGLISIFNGIGRVLFGGVFDKIGGKKSMLLNEILYLVSIISMLVSVNSNQLWLLIIAFIFTGLAYGGVPTTSSAFIGSFYGRKYYSINFSLMNMNLLIASFGGTIAGKLYDISESYMWTICTMLALVIAGAVIANNINKD